MASYTANPILAPTPNENVTYLTSSEINEFLDTLDRNGDGFIDYTEVEHQLDLVHDQIIENPLPHHLHHESKDDHIRHQFLRSIIGSESKRIPRSEFAERVKEWKIPSMRQEDAEELSRKEYMRSIGWYRRFRSYWSVHGPEILFIALVVALQLAFAIWQFVKYLTSDLYTPAFGWGVVLAKTCAGALYPTFFFVALSMSRYFSTILRRSYRLSRFINWDLSQEFHIIISCVALVLATIHAIGHLTGTFVFGSMTSRQAAVAAALGPDAVPRPYRDYVASRPGWTGITALGLFYLLAILSMPKVRKWNYELFQLGHLLMYPIFGLLAAHGTAALLQWPMLGYFLAFPVALIIIERITRVCMGFYSIGATIQVLDKETVELKVTIPSEYLWKYRAGQYVFLQVPQLSFWQWHPFTVSRCDGRDMQLHIKADGRWTTSLRDLGNGDAPTPIKVGINGPFGAPAQRFYDFSHTIICGAGIGVTPFSGILADLQAKDNKLHGGPTNFEIGDVMRRANSRFSERHAARGQSTPNTSRTVINEEIEEKSAPADEYRRVDFHWMVRDKTYLLWFSDLLNAISRSQLWHHANDPNPHLDIRIQTHVTQKRKEIATHIYRWLLELHRTDEHPESPITGLINSSHFGRPDFVAILDAHYEDMKHYRAQSFKSGKKADCRVGVFFCGAPGIGEMLSDRCRILTARGRKDGTKIEYFFMMEVFG